MKNGLSFEEKVEKVGVGGRINLGYGDWSSASAHPEGIITRQNIGVEHYFYLNNLSPVGYVRGYHREISSPNGMIYEDDTGRYFIANKVGHDAREIKPDEVREFMENAAPIHVTRVGDKIFINEDIEINEGQWDAWEAHMYGAMLRYGNKFILVVTRTKVT